MDESYPEEQVDAPLEPSNTSSSQEARRADSPTIFQKDDEYYIEGVFVVFQAENCLFRVPTYIFAEAPLFKGMFNLPQNAASLEGSSPDDPIILPENVSSVDFENLLEALHPQELLLKLSLTSPKWVSVLKLSTMWFLNKFRALAISELERLNELTSLQKVQLGRTCKISSWVVNGFREFILASSSIPREDAVVLALGSVVTTYRLCRIREKTFSSINAVGIVQRMIEDEFMDELSEIRHHEEAFKVVEPDMPLPAAETIFEEIAAAPEPIGTFGAFAFGPPSFDILDEPESSEPRYNSSFGWGGSWGGNELQENAEAVSFSKKKNKKK